MVAAVLRPRSIAFALLLAAAALLWAGERSMVRVAGQVPSTPAMLGAWSGREIPPDPRAIEILETSDVALMEYQRGAQEPPLWFAQVAGFGNRAAFHPPELCYVGSHYEVLERGPITLTIGGQPRQVMRLVLAQGQDRYEAWYWFTAGRRVTANYYQQQVWLMWDALNRRPMSGTLVRISTPLDDPAAVRQRLESFVTSFVIRDAATSSSHAS